MTSVAESNAAPTVQSWSVWHIDPRHSLAQFSVRHMMLSKVRGQFTGISGTIVDAADDPKRSSVKAAIDVTTLITGDPQRDEHLRSPDFFDVANHPTMTFESRSIAGSREHFKVTGDLTIRGQTREVTLDGTFNGLGTNPLGQAVTASEDRTHVTGARVADRAAAREEGTLLADLTVDATGRGSRTPAWLETFGYRKPLRSAFRSG